MSPETLAPAMMIASGSIHAVVNAILKGGKDKMAGRALIDGSSAVLLPAILLVPLPHGAWGWLAATAVIHCAYLYALVRVRGERLLRGLSDPARYRASGDRGTGDRVLGILGGAVLILTR